MPACRLRRATRAHRRGIKQRACRAALSSSRGVRSSSTFCRPLSHRRLRANEIMRRQSTSTSTSARPPTIVCAACSQTMRLTGIELDPREAIDDFKPGTRGSNLQDLRILDHTRAIRWCSVALTWKLTRYRSPLGGSCMFGTDAKVQTSRPFGSGLSSRVGNPSRPPLLVPRAVRHAVHMLADDVVTLAGALLQSRAIEDLDIAPGVGDHFPLVERCSRDGDRVSLNAQHVG
jgi:hypothetical protein